MMRFTNGAAFAALGLVVALGASACNDEGGGSGGAAGDGNAVVSSTGPFQCPDASQVADALGDSSWVDNPTMTNNADMCSWAIMNSSGDYSDQAVVVQHPIIEDQPGPAHDLAWWRRTVDATWGDATRDAPEFGGGSFLRSYPESCDVYTGAPDGQTMYVSAQNNTGDAAGDLCDRAATVIDLIRGHVSAPATDTDAAAATDTSSPESAALAYVEAWHAQDCGAMTAVLVDQELQDSFGSTGCTVALLDQEAADGSWTEHAGEELTVVSVSDDGSQTKVTISSSGEDEEWNVYLVSVGSQWLVDDFKYH